MRDRSPDGSLINQMSCLCEHGFIKQWGSKLLSELLYSGQLDVCQIHSHHKHPWMAS